MILGTSGQKDLRWHVVILCAVFMCFVMATFSQYSLIVKYLSASSGLSEQTLLSADVFKSFGVVASLFLSNFFCRRFGRRSVFLYSVIATVLPQFLVPALHDSSVLYLVKFFQGTTFLVYPAILVLIMRLITERRRAFAIALFTGITNGGGSVGSAVAGMLAEKLSWQWSSYCIGVILLLVGIPCALVVGAAGRTLQTETTDRRDDPKIKLRARPSFAKIALLSASLFGVIFIYQGIVVDWPVYALSLGYKEDTVGRIAIGITICIISSCIIAGHLSDRLAEKSKNAAVARLRVQLLGQIAVLPPLLLFIFYEIKDLRLFVLASLIFALFGSWSLSTFYSMIPEFFSPDKLDGVIGVISAIGNLGLPAAPFFIGVLFGANDMWSLGWGMCLVFVAPCILCTCLLFSRKMNQAEH